MRLYVHIGTHKSGTTSIQAFLRQYAEALMEGGIYVPSAGTVSVGHHNIGWGLRGDPRFKQECGDLDNLIDELSHVTSPNAVISSEDLEYLGDRPDLLERFEHDLIAADIEPSYILFYRRPDTYALSLYSELLHHGLTVPFSTFAAEVLTTGKFVMHGDWSFYFDTGALIRRWQGATQAPLTAISYDEAANGEGVVPRFLSLIGTPANVIRAGRDAQVLNTRKPADISQFDRIIWVHRLRRRFVFRRF